MSNIYSDSPYSHPIFPIMTNHHSILSPPPSQPVALLNHAPGPSHIHSSLIDPIPSSSTTPIWSPNSSPLPSHPHAILNLTPLQPSPPLSPRQVPVVNRKSSLITKIRDSARDVVAAAVGRDRSPSAHGQSRLNSNASPLSSPHHHPITPPPASPHSPSGIPTEVFPPLYLGVPAAIPGSHPSHHHHDLHDNHGLIAPSHGDSSPPPTIERRSSFKEVYQSLKSRTLSLGRSRSGGSDGHYDKKDNSNTLANKYGVLDKQLIGKGATAVVRLVHKPSHIAGEDHVYAVKEFRRRRKKESEREYIKKLTSEFCISSSLKHINVVRTMDLIQDEHAHWCEVMEYCSGGDLYSVIKTGKMSRDEMNCCFKQLIHGVHYLHSNGVAHRDIKPENLLLDSQGHIKITDFGVSEVFKVCWEREPHMSKGVCGSEPYIAPEEFNGAEYDAREVDIWACGIVYYAMVYSGIPWRHATSDDPNFAYYLKYRTRDFEAIDRLPDGCRELIYKILEPSPAKRITTSDILEDEWFKSIEACFECLDYGDMSNLEGMDVRTRLNCNHIHHVQVTEKLVPRSRTGSHAAGKDNIAAAAAAAAAAANAANAANAAAAAAANAQVSRVASALLHTTSDLASVGASVDIPSSKPHKPVNNLHSTNAARRSSSSPNSNTASPVLLPRSDSTSLSPVLDLSSSLSPKFIDSTLATFKQPNGLERMVSTSPAPKVPSTPPPSGPCPHGPSSVPVTRTFSKSPVLGPRSSSPSPHQHHNPHHPHHPHHHSHHHHSHHPSNKRSVPNGTSTGLGMGTGNGSGAGRHPGSLSKIEAAFRDLLHIH